MSIEVDGEKFEKEDLESEKLGLVHFWGSQCRPCLAFMQHVKSLEKDHRGRVKS